MCRDKLKTSVMCWLCGYTDVSTGVSVDQRDGFLKGNSINFIHLSVFGGKKKKFFVSREDVTGLE